MNLEELRQMVKQGESYRLEFKESLSGQGDILKELCAFANTVGGTLLAGVTDKGDIKGVVVSSDTETQLVNRILDSIQEPIAPEVELVPLGNGKAVMRLHVDGHPRAAHTVKGKPYWRVGSVSKPMPWQEYEKRIKESYPKIWETILVDEASGDDLDFEAVKSYIKRYNKERGERLELSPRDVLLSRSCAVDIDGKLKPTRAGILLFGREPQRFFMKSHITVIRFGGRSVTDRLLDSRDFNGTLIDLIDRAEQYVHDHYDVMQRPVEGKATREDIPQYPPWAVRELIVNAVAHRDYSIYGARIMIQMFRDRIEFHSPGGFPGDITPDTVLSKQLTRNPTIGKVLHDLRYIEEFGMGLDNVFTLVREHQLKPELPTIQEIGELVIVTLHSPEEFLASELPAVEGDLNDRQLKARDHARSHGSISSGELMQMTKVTRRTAIRDLNDIVDKGYLIVVGAGRSRRYRPR